MKYQDYIKGYIGQPVKIQRHFDSSILTVTPAKVDPSSRCNRCDILEVHEDFVVLQEFIYGGMPGVAPEYKRRVIPLCMIQFELPGSAPGWSC